MGLRKRSDSRVSQSRPHTTARRTGILHLPDEVLIEIFKLVRGPVKYDVIHARRQTDLQGDYTTIQNLRLTNRRFRDVGSRFLVRNVTVKLNCPQALQSLEDISKHHEIGKGVEYVTVFLDYYSRTLAENEGYFWEYCEERLREALPPKREWYGPWSATRNTRNLIITFHNLSKGTARPDELFREFVHQAYQDYKLFYERQQREYGQRIQRIASAMAEMPFAKQLILGRGRDLWLRQPHVSTRLRSREVVGRPDVILRRLCRPIYCWEDGCCSGAFHPPAEILIDLPIAIHRAGTQLTGLQIHTYPPDEIYRLAMTPQKRRQLKAATSQLRAFHYEARDLRYEVYTSSVKHSLNAENEGFWPSRTAAEYAVLREYFTSLVTSPFLNELIFNGCFLCKKGWRLPLSLGSIMLAPRKHLEFLDFHGPFGAGDVEELLRRVEGNDAQIRLNGYLVDGTWEAVLDALRGQVSARCVVGDKGNSLLGADCAGLRRDVRKFLKRKLSRRSRSSLSETEEGEDGGSDYGNRVTLYVRELYHENPIRELRMPMDVYSDDDDYDDYDEEDGGGGDDEDEDMNEDENEDEDEDMNEDENEDEDEDMDIDMASPSDSDSGTDRSTDACCT